MGGGTEKRQIQNRRGSRGRWGGRPPLGRRDPRRRRRFLRLKGRKKEHWCLLDDRSTPFKHYMAMNILKSCKFVFAYVKNHPSPSHIRSSIPWRPPLAEILDPRLQNTETDKGISVEAKRRAGIIGNWEEVTRMTIDY